MYISKIFAHYLRLLHLRRKPVLSFSSCAIAIFNENVFQNFLQVIGLSGKQCFLISRSALEKKDGNGFPQSSMEKL